MLPLFLYQAMKPSYRLEIEALNAIVEQLQIQNELLSRLIEEKQEVPAPKPKGRPRRTAV